MKKKYILTSFLAVTCILFAVFIRVIGLMHTPPSLYWEEVALGYDAYSILKTGKDHHGNPWPIVAFESFGDWKPALYFYTIVPFIAVFDLVPWVVRAPSVLAGISIVIAIGILSKKAAELLKFKNANLYGVIGLFLAAVSSWAIHFSRGGWEVNLATALVSWGMVTGLFAVNDKEKNKSLQPLFVVTSTVVLVLAVYAYHGTRLIAPLLGICLGFYWWSEIFKQDSFQFKKIWSVLFSGLLACMIMAPLLLSLQSPQVSQRFAETSIFSDLSVIEESNKNKELAGNSFASRLLYHRYVLFGREVLTNYFDHFNLKFLFISGDTNPRHGSGYGGHLYYQELLFVAIGIGLILYNRKKIGWILLAWWLLAILPASLTKATPHALRILPAMPAILVISSLGLGYFFEYCSIFLEKHTFASKKVSKWILGISITLMYMVTFTFWWRHYWTAYPQQSSNEWQYGYQQMVSEIEMKRTLSNMPVYITREQGRPAMYYWFFTKTNPALVQAEAASAEFDQGEFLTFQNSSFPNTTHEIKISESGALIASSENGKNYFIEQGFQIETITEISNTFNQIIWSVYIVTP